MVLRNDVGGGGGDGQQLSCCAALRGSPNYLGKGRRRGGEGDEVIFDPFCNLLFFLIMISLSALTSFSFEDKN